MIDNFQAFAKMVTASFQELVKAPSVFVVGLDNDVLYREYLAAFPAGSNPPYKNTTEHDCSCCKHFIRRAGSVVTVEEDGAFRTVWDGTAEGPYRVVAARLRDVVRAAHLCDLFRVGEKELSFGADRTRVMDKDTQQVHTWHHFYTGEIPKNLRTPSPDQVRGDYRTTAQVFERGLVELTPSAVETVLSLSSRPTTSIAARSTSLRLSSSRRCSARFCPRAKDASEASSDGRTLATQRRGFATP